jgi:excisionase family DNA binding protein
MVHAVQKQSDALTSREAADLLGVNQSSVKRWADQGKLRCLRTPGGHRRFSLVDVESFRREQECDGSTEWAEELTHALVRGQQAQAESLLLRRQFELHAWEHVGDEVGKVLGLIGERWTMGELSISEEHIASECLSRCISRILHLFPRRPDAELCALALIPGEQHTLGLSLTELVLAEHGWNSMWLGRNTPVETLIDVVKYPTVKMLGLSASSFSSDPTGLSEVIQILGPVCMAYSTTLLLGGQGKWPEDVFDSVRVRSFSEFGSFLRFVG